MTNKTMPERITVHRINNGGTFPDNVRITELKPGVASLSCIIEECEYVRADVATGDSSEPLENGQWRWVRRYNIKCIWVLARVIIDKDGTPYLSSHDGTIVRRACKYEKIGPVIRPPND